MRQQERRHLLLLPESRETIAIILDGGILLIEILHRRNPLLHEVSNIGSERVGACESGGVDGSEVRVGGMEIQGVLEGDVDFEQAHEIREIDWRGERA